MNAIRENAKAIAAALSTIIVLLLRPLMPQMADPMFQPALEVVISFAIVAAAVWMVPNKPKVGLPPTGMDDRVPPAPILAAVIGAALLTLSSAACTTQQPVSPAETFSRSCTVVGEAMLQVNQLRRQGKVDDTTFVRIDDAYDAAVTSCATLPVGETATAVAAEKVTAFLAAAGGVTGEVYGY